MVTGWLNVQRRDLTAAQRAIVAAKTWSASGTDNKGGRPSKDKPIQSVPVSLPSLAKTFKCSPTSITQARDLLSESPDLAGRRKTLREIIPEVMTHRDPATSPRFPGRKLQAQGGKCDMQARMVPERPFTRCKRRWKRNPAARAFAEVPERPFTRCKAASATRCPATGPRRVCERRQI